MIYIQLFFTFFKIGLFTFGGGYAMLPMIQQDVVRYNWLTKEEIVDFVAISESTPGPFAVNISTFVGMKTGGLLGAFSATLGVVLPSFIIILLVAKIYERFQKNKMVNGAMIGLKGAVVGLIGTVVLSTFVSTFRYTVQTKNVIEGVVGLGLLGLVLYGLHKKVHPIILLIASAICGVVIKAII